MTRWEYRTHRVETKGGVARKVRATEDYLAVLSNLGREGWELVAAMTLSENEGRTNAIEFILKRPVA
jgi:hypothetical protein